MPSTNPQDPSHPSTPPQSIPLRDLDLTTRPGSADITTGWEPQHSRGRSLLSGGSRPTSGGNAGPRYERLGDTSPSPTERQRNRGPPLTVASRQLQHVTDEHETPVSPVGNPAEFQAAMGFAGLLVPDISVSHAPRNLTPSMHSVDMDGSSPYADSIFGDAAADDNSYFASESDRAPLTDSNSLQPISGAQPSTPDGQRHDRSRSSFQSVNFNTPDTAYRGSRLGDDLVDVEAAVSPHGGRSRSHSYGNSLTPDSRNRSRSPSNAGALSRAGSIMRAMSTRVVNPEIAEITARIEASSRDESIPSTISSLSDESEVRFKPKHKKDPLAAGPNYQQNLPTAPVEKAMRFFGGAQPEPDHEEEPEKPPNPLKGKTLGIFGPESKIRKKLCDLLVYPLTEPAILILIVVQTVLLAVDASQDVYKHPRPTRFLGSPLDLALLGLFVVFTIEMVARIIVSGLVYNAPEYSSRKGKKGFKSGILEKYHTVFKPQRQRSLRVPGNKPVEAPTVLRSFSAIQSDNIRTVEQAQRLQLARRAFLRHSFNRLDFVAVISFWAAFVLSIVGVEDNSHLYIFRMLSCLRILRLLALTNGTAVCVFCLCWSITF